MVSAQRRPDLVSEDWGRCGIEDWGRWWWIMGWWLGPSTMELAEEEERFPGLL